MGDENGVASFWLWAYYFGLQGSSHAYGEKEYHGADSIFEKEGIIILWAIFKGSTEETSWVYIKMISIRKGTLSLSYL